MAPLLQLYEYGDVPPVTFKLMVPLLPPLHATLLVELTLLFKAAAGCEILIAEVVNTQPLASVTVTV